MKAEFMHIGIPVTNRKNGMVYEDKYKVWVTDPDNYDLSIEYLKYEEGTPFPEILHKNPHICYMVEDMQPYLDEAQQVIFGPVRLDDITDFAYILLDDTLIELQASAKENA